MFRMDGTGRTPRKIVVTIPEYPEKELLGGKLLEAL